MTYREGARRLQFVTGHDSRGALPELDWTAFADPTATTAVYMPRRRLPEFVDKAVAAGLPDGTPVVAICNATRPNEKIISGTASTICRLLAEGDPNGPLLILIGEAFRRTRRVVPEGLSEALPSYPRALMLGSLISGVVPGG
nr:SAM-dependent methyltransferase [Enterovirga sp. DB1703]